MQTKEKEREREREKISLKENIVRQLPELRDLLALVERMKYPVEFGGEAETHGLVELAAKELERLVVALVDGELVAQVHDVVDRLQLGHLGREHHDEQVDDETRVAADCHVGRLAQKLESIFVSV